MDRPPLGTPTLTGWIGGPRSSAFANAPASRSAISPATNSPASSLARRIPADQLICCATHDWQTDPFTFGAYSYIPARGLDAVLEMATPVENTLYFAGEHTDVTGHWGTVHAAIRSGLRAAWQILRP